MISKTVNVEENQESSCSYYTIFYNLDVQTLKQRKDTIFFAFKELFCFPKESKDQGVYDFTLFKHFGCHNNFSNKYLSQSQ
jgi:hypothetical protein